MFMNEGYVKHGVHDQVTDDFWVLLDAWPMISTTKGMGFNEI